MITIPTSELIGLITDVAGFAPASKDALNHGILLEWDGEALHAAAFDVLSAGRSTWVPEEGEEGFEEGEAGDDVIGAEWGSNLDHEQWKVFIDAADAKEIAKVFKLPTKHRLTPVTVKVNAYNSLIVERSRETGHSQLHAMFRTDDDQAARFPDVDGIAHEAADHTSDTAALTFSPSRLAAFGAVRSFNFMQITAGAEGYASCVMIGNRFTGFIYEATDAARQAAYARNATRGKG